MIRYQFRIVHDDVIKWKYFPRYWPFVWWIRRSPVNSPHNGQWCRALMFSSICAWIYKRLSRQSWGWWFQTPSRSLWRNFNGQQWPADYMLHCMPVDPDSKVYGAYMGPTGPRWAPCWPHEPCYLLMLWFLASPCHPEKYKYWLYGVLIYCICKSLSYGCQSDEPWASLVTTNKIINIYGFIVVKMLLMYSVLHCILLGIKLLLLIMNKDIINLNTDEYISNCIHCPFC